ncbi:UNKNOWN [Stylonychia lemnae]|uniref:Uncharacterized protein n=1 Tax=Stylonychia lemnae TaxID=5949 RepID=A0A078B4P5_STYLE|nr:UNKNOWN [Stylonychia lemnae]|eukprot:CDW88197.1 UNKNOWN [Stylonychia lemnae]
MEKSNKSKSKSQSGLLNPQQTLYVDQSVNKSDQKMDISIKNELKPPRSKSPRKTLYNNFQSFKLMMNQKSKSQKPSLPKTPSMPVNIDSNIEIHVNHKETQNSIKSTQDFNYLETFLYYLRKKSPIHGTKELSADLYYKGSSPDHMKGITTKTQNINKYKALLTSDYLSKISIKYNQDKQSKNLLRSSKAYQSLVHERGGTKEDQGTQTQLAYSNPNSFLINQYHQAQQQITQQNFNKTSNLAFFMDGRGKINQSTSPVYTTTQLNQMSRNLLGIMKVDGQDSQQNQQRGMKRGPMQSEKWKPLWMCTKERLLISNPIKYQGIVDKIPYASSVQTIPLLTQSQLKSFQSQLDIEKRNLVKTAERKSRIRTAIKIQPKSQQQEYQQQNSRQKYFKTADERYNINLSHNYSKDKLIDYDPLEPHSLKGNYQNQPQRPSTHYNNSKKGSTESPTSKQQQTKLNEKLQNLRNLQSGKLERGNQQKASRYYQLSELLSEKKQTSGIQDMKRQKVHVYLNQVLGSEFDLSGDYAITSEEFSGKQSTAALIRKSLEKF